MDTMRRKWEKNVTECQLDKLKRFERHLELNLSEDKRVYEENLFVDGNFSKSRKYFKIFNKQIQSQVKSTWMIKVLHQISIKLICWKNTFSQFLATPSM